MNRFSVVILGLILLAYLSIGALYAINTPAWQVPDEPAHYNYIRHIAQAGTLPMLQAGDYDQNYLEQLKAEKFPADKPIDTIRYESYQPPLYYLLLTPVFLLLGGALVPLRLFSLLLGGGVIVFAFLVVRELFPTRPVLALTTAGFIAFIPQHVAIMAGVNSDSLAEWLMAMGLWLVVKGTRGTVEKGGKGNEGKEGNRSGLRRKVALALVIGAAFLTKVTVYTLAPVAALAILLRWLRRSPRVEWRPGARPKLATGGLEKGESGWAVASGGMPLTSPEGQTIQRVIDLQSWRLALWRAVHPLLSDLLIVFVPALLLGALYWGRNVAVYGWPDFLGAIRHDAVVQGQPRTSEWIAAYGVAEVARRFVTTTFQSFWGQFGWMGVLMEGRVYLALLLYSAALTAGALIALRDRWSAVSARQRDGLTLLGASGVITLALYLYYNVSFVQHQGRYLFPALVPLALAAAVGIGQWVGWIAQGARIKGQGARERMEFAFTLAPLALMAALDVFALYRFVIPQLR